MRHARIAHTIIRKEAETRFGGRCLDDVMNMACALRLTEDDISLNRRIINHLTSGQGAVSLAAGKLAVDFCSDGCR